jgi:hypothetical protein
MVSFCVFLLILLSYNFLLYIVLVLNPQKGIGYIRYLQALLFILTKHFLRNVCALVTRRPNIQPNDLLALTPGKHI